MPSFGGHIAISDDVTTHSVLVMARTERVPNISFHINSVLSGIDANIFEGE